MTIRCQAWGGSLFTESFGGRAVYLVHDEDESSIISPSLSDFLVDHDLTDDQDDYLDALTTFTEEWGIAKEPKLPGATPAEMVSAHLSESGLTGADLAPLLGVSASLASRILKGERNLTTSHIATLCERFRLDPLGLLPDAR